MGTIKVRSLSVPHLLGPCFYITSRMFNKNTTNFGLQNVNVFSTNHTKNFPCIVHTSYTNNLHFMQYTFNPTEKWNTFPTL